MNGRNWGIVAVFAVAAALLVVWLLVPATTPSDTRGATTADPVRHPPKAVPLTTDRTRLMARETALRQRRVANPDGMVAVPVGGVFSLDEAGLERAISNRRSDLQACYDTARLHTPALSPKMSLALRIEPVEGRAWGKVASVDSDSSSEATVLEGCVTTVLEELRFDAIEPTTVRYPIAFTVGAE